MNDKLREVSITRQLYWFDVFYSTNFLNLHFFFFLPYWMYILPFLILID